jgi:hypothetical protein
METRQELYHTTNLSAAAILMTCGFKLVTFTHIVRADGKESKEFWFEGHSDTYRMKAEEVVFYATKGAEALKTKDPESPVLWMRGALTNRATLIDIIKNAPRMVEITNGTRKALIAETASEETKRQIAAML